jgi:MFS family permease
MMMVSCRGLFLFAISFSIVGMLILGVVMFALGPFALLYVQLRPTTSPLIYYSARAMHGLVNWMAIALSAMADVLPARLRAPGVGVLMGGFWFGLCRAPSLAIFLGHLQVIVIACSVQLCGLVCAIMFFPETLPPHVAEEARMLRNSEASNGSPRSLTVLPAYGLRRKPPACVSPTHRSIVSPSKPGLSKPAISWAAIVSKVM